MDASMDPTADPVRVLKSGWPIKSHWTTAERTPTPRKVRPPMVRTACQVGHRFSQESNSRHPLDAESWLSPSTRRAFRRACPGSQRLKATPTVAKNAPSAMPKAPLPPWWTKNCSATPLAKIATPRPANDQSHQRRHRIVGNRPRMTSVARPRAASCRAAWSGRLPWTKTAHFTCILSSSPSRYWPNSHRSIGSAAGRGHPEAEARIAASRTRRPAGRHRSRRPAPRSTPR